MTARWAVPACVWTPSQSSGEHAGRRCRCGTAGLRARTTGTLFWWLLAAVGFMTGFGYLVFSAVTGLGDFGTGSDGALPGVPMPWLWRLAMGVVGYWLYDRSVLWIVGQLGEQVGGGPDRVWRIRSIALLCYIAGGITCVLIGLINPEGLVIVLTSAAAASLGGTSGFAWGPYRAHPSNDDPRPRHVLPRSWAWILVSLASVLAYAVVFGPTLFN